MREFVINQRDSNNSAKIELENDLDAKYATHTSTMIEPYFYNEHVSVEEFRDSYRYEVSPVKKIEAVVWGYPPVNRTFYF